PLTNYTHRRKLPSARRWRLESSVVPTLPWRALSPAPRRARGRQALDGPLQRVDLLDGSEARDGVGVRAGRVGERLRDEPVLGQRLLARRRRHHLLARLARLGVVVELDAPAAEEEPVGVRRRRRRERPVARHARLRREGLCALPLRIARRRSGGLFSSLVARRLGHRFVRPSPRVHRVPMRSETAGGVLRSELSATSKQQSLTLQWHCKTGSLSAFSSWLGLACSLS
ncbi:unnamed protein product, partial [Pelagomonas calceolata]